jgi:hypothetical protein
MKTIAATRIKDLTLIVAASIATYGLIPTAIGAATSFIKELTYLLRGVPS